MWAWCTFTTLHAQFDEQSTSTRFFFWVLVESACVRVCAPMKWVDQRRGGPVLKRLWPLWWSVRPGGGQRRWALILRSDFLAWRNVHRYYTRTVRIERVSLHFHRHIIVRERVSRARWVSARPASGFRCLEPFLFNEFAAENECALYHSLWLNPLVKAARYNSQFILLYHLLQLNILWVDSSPGARFLSQSVNYAHSDGTWLESIRGTDKAELCVGRIGRFMWRQMSASVVTSLRVL